MKTNTNLVLGILLCLFTTNLLAQNNAPTEIEIPEGKALVYIYRPAFAGTVINMKTYCDGKLIGTTRGKEYIYAIVDAGQRTITSKASNSDEIKIDFIAGETYYIHQRAVAGFPYAATRLDVHDEDKSLRKLARCRLAKRFEPNSLQG